MHRYRAAATRESTSDDFQQQDSRSLVRTPQSQDASPYDPIKSTLSSSTNAMFRSKPSSAPIRASSYDPNGGLPNASSRMSSAPLMPYSLGSVPMPTVSAPVRKAPYSYGPNVGLPDSSSRMHSAPPMPYSLESAAMPPVPSSIGNYPYSFDQNVGLSDSSSRMYSAPLMPYSLSAPEPPPQSPYGMYPYSYEQKVGQRNASVHTYSAPPVPYKLGDSYIPPVPPSTWKPYDSNDTPQIYASASPILESTTPEPGVLGNSEPRFAQHHELSTSSQPDLGTLPPFGTGQSYQVDNLLDPAQLRKSPSGLSAHALPMAEPIPPSEASSEADSLFAPFTPATQSKSREKRPTMAIRSTHSKSSSNHSSTSSRAQQEIPRVTSSTEQASNVGWSKETPQEQARILTRQSHESGRSQDSLQELKGHEEKIQPTIRTSELDGDSNHSKAAGM